MCKYLLSECFLGSSVAAEVMSYRNTRKRKENGRMINTLNLKAQCKNKDLTGICFLACETSASSLSAVYRCLLTCLMKGRVGNSAVVLRTLL